MGLAEVEREGGSVGGVHVGDDSGEVGVGGRGWRGHFVGEIV